jgi:hypothetical protein
METKIDWKKVWIKFDEWISTKGKSTRCKTCDHSESNFPDWEEQQRKIQQLVNAQVREL